MDKKGFISLETIFSIFIILIIVTSILFYVQSNLEFNESIESNVDYRIILDNLANCINQVNSNGDNFSKKIVLPQKDYSYKITVEKKKLTIEYSNKKGESIILPIAINRNYELYSGQSYWIEKKDGEVKIL
ncbi:hypothetical protein [uncultured Methanobrevibacter sp.]|uniref:hypothetical protein n=1 Tax=uncultured Methanobrevibacter sp. TaxID=253161 RepID=UPI002619DE6A|nr:hypothetical protein [uncultured Methanobrevibacter sp.]